MSTLPTPQRDVIYDMVPEAPWWSPNGTAIWGSLSSIGMHLLAVFALSLITFSSSEEIQTLITSMMSEDIEDVEEQFKFDTTMTDQIGNGSDANILGASQAVAQQLGNDPQQEMEKSLQSDVLPPDVEIQEEMPEPSQAEMLAVISSNGATEHVGGVEGAVDRIAFEIANRLRREKLLVNWLFDNSPSLGPQRARIADRVDTIYKQLSAMNVTDDMALKSTVTVFGDKVSILTHDPVDDPAELVQIVRGIKSQEGGQENVFAAVQSVTQRFLSYRTKMRRGMMNVIITDEAGSDAVNLEAALQIVRRNSVPCFVVGEAAPFGKREVETSFKLESGEDVIGVMTRGPESLYQERINKVGFWGVSPRNVEDMSSGFGPYGLTRLCVESGGLFLVSNDQSGIRFDASVMRNYAPDYRPIKLIADDLKKNMAKQVLIELAEESKRNEFQMVLPDLFFPAPNDQVLREGITERQKPLADLDYKLDRILQRLEQGEKDRPKIKEPRLQAAYDLELGRISALRARAFGYNAMLAEMKSNPKKFEKPNSNAWRLVPVDAITSGAAVKKLATRASDCLTRVMTDHSGTPWAKLAEVEQSTKLGWAWKEETFNMNPGGGGGGAAPRPAPKFIEETDEKTGKKVRRQLPDTPQRRDI